MIFIRLFDTSALCQKTQERKSEPRILYPAKLIVEYKGYKVLSTPGILFP